MSKVLSIICFFLAGYVLTAQTFTVGSTCCNYHLVNKTFIDNVQPPVVWNSIDLFPIDIDGDLIDDLVIKSYHFMGNSSNASSGKCIYVTSPNNTESAMAASSYTNSLFNSSIIDNLSFGTNYSSNLNWDTLPSNLNINTNLQTLPIIAYIPVVYEYWNRTLVSAQYINGQQINPFYVAFRKIQHSVDTIYGWIKMDSYFPGKVIDYAYNHGSVTGIKKNIDINSTISVSPNPAIDKLKINIDNFQSEDKYVFKLISLEGKILKIQSLDDANNEVNINDYDNGIYFVELSLGKSIFRKKLVINR